MPPNRQKPGPLGDLDLRRHLADPAIKQRYVTTMFDLVAPRYDRFTRWFSYGLDRRWKRQLMAQAVSRLTPGTVVLDAACGTGDLALGLAAAHPGGCVIGLDPSAPMLAAFRGRCRDTGIDSGRSRALVRLIRGDLMAVPVPDGSVGMVTVGYGFRNVPDAAAALDQIRRALRPGGWLVSLDFFRPATRFWAAALLGYLRAAGRLYGWWWHREPNAYGYIAESLRGFLTVDEFGAALQRAGFEVVASHRKLGGGIGLHVARRR